MFEFISLQFYIVFLFLWLTLTFHFFSISSFTFLLSYYFINTSLSYYIIIFTCSVLVFTVQPHYVGPNTLLWEISCVFLIFSIQWTQWVSYCKGRIWNFFNFYVVVFTIKNVHFIVNLYFIYLVLFFLCECSFVEVIGITSRNSSFLRDSKKQVLEPIFVKPETPPKELYCRLIKCILI